MKLRSAALAVALVVLLTAPALTGAPGQGPGDPAPAGRAGPPSGTDQWDIVGNITLTGHHYFEGNITIYTESTLIIKDGGSLTIPYNRSFRRALVVKAGGSVEVRDASRLEVPGIEAESGTGLTVMNRSVLRTSGALNASTATLLDCAIIVAAPDGVLPGESGAPAFLSFPGGGTTMKTTLTISGGNGAPGLNATGMRGGSGGDVTVNITSLGLDDLNITLTAGHGADGGSAGGTSANGGSGGAGGSLRVTLVSATLRRTSFHARAGNGGRGAAGYTTTSAATSAGDGGEGGSGGSISLAWSGRSINIASSSLTLVSGNGAKGGDGGMGNYNMKSGGNGTAGGSGGSVSALIASTGSMNIIDSDLSLVAGYGSPGGIFGRALLGGTDGRAGDGGAGGSAQCGLGMVDSFTGTNASLSCQAGNGGAGGVGTSGGRGGAGGVSNLTMDIAYQMAEPTFVMKGRQLSSRGGDGGDGGRGLSVGQIKGQPGDGGKGGGARLAIAASSYAELHNTSVVCDEGAGGATDWPGVPGNPGVGEIIILTHRVTMWHCLVTQTMGPVDGMDNWTLWSTNVTASQAFLPSREAGVAEVYFRVFVTVQDVYGIPVTDGSVTVELMKTDLKTVLQTNRADPLGKTMFWALWSRQTPNPEETVRSSTYILLARDDYGGFSRSVSVQPSGDVHVTLTIISKPFAPLVTITQPDARLAPILHASDYIRFDGTVEPLTIEGEAWDHNQNPDPSVSRVELRIGEDAPWVEARLEPSPRQANLWIWNYTWDVYNWALGMLSRYPLGIIPAPIYARCYNDRYWSDDAAHGGNVTLQNITVRLVRLPPAPPVIEITSPVQSDAANTNFTEVRYEKPVVFDARIASSGETRVVKWVWCFDDSGGFKPQFSSPDSPQVTIRYSKELEDAYFFVVLRVYDNESTTRAALVHQGVSMDEFPYFFDPVDGSVSIKLRVHVLPSPAPPPRFPIEKYGVYIALGALALVMALASVRAFQLRQRHIKEKRKREERETLRIEVAELKCARCGDAIPDAEKGCMRCRAQDRISAAQSSISHLKTLGVNVSDAEVLLEEAVDAFDSKSFDEGISRADAASEKAKVLESRYMDTSGEISGWENKISALKIDAPEADVTELETKVYHARLALGRGDHAEALKCIEGMEPLIERAAKVGQRKTYETLVESCRRMVENVRKRGVVVAEAVGATLREAEAALEKLDYERVKELCKQAELKVRETNRLFVRASESLRRAEARVLNAKGMGRPVGSCDDWVSEARSALSSGAYARTMDLSNKILGFFGIAPQPVPPADQRVDWSREVARIEGGGAAVETKKKPTIVAPAAPAPAGPEPSREELERSQKTILTAQSVVNSAREAGVDVTDPEELLEKAKEAHKAHQYDVAMEMAKSARFLAEELVRAAPKAKPPPPAPAPAPAKTCALPGEAPAPAAADAEPGRTILEAEAIVAELARAGADVSGPEYALNRARCARDGGSPVVALTYAKEAIQAAREIQAQHDDAKKTLDEAESLFKEAKAKGLDVADAEFQLKQARTAMEGAAYGRVTDAAKNALGMLRELIPAPGAPVPAPGPKCPGCGREVKPGWKTCPFCGARIGEAPPPPTAPAPAAAPGLTCPSCGASLKPHWRVCPSCGASLGAPAPAPAAERCPLCGQRVDPSMTSCPACKTSLVPAGKPPEVPPEPPKKVLKVAKRPAPPEPQPEARPPAPQPPAAPEKKVVLKISKKPKAPDDSGESGKQQP